MVAARCWLAVSCDALLGCPVRNSNHRDAGAVFFTRAEMAAWIAGVKNAEFDDLC